MNHLGQTRLTPTKRGSLLRTVGLALLICMSLSACALIDARSSSETSQLSQKMSAKPDRIDLDRLFASPSLSGASARGVKFSPDGKRVTFLKSRADDIAHFDLWQFDVATGAQSMLVDSTLLEPKEIELSEEEKALRERKRIAGSKGIVDYDWGTSQTLLVPLGGDLHLVTLTDAGATSRKLTSSEAFEYDAKISPGGKYVSFIRAGELYAIELSTGRETRLSPAAEPDRAISYGVAEFVAQEEMDRYTGYWWSTDDAYIAYTRVDESTVDIIPRFDIAAKDVTVIEQRYPRAGRPNAIVDLVVRDMATGTTKAVNWRRDDWGPATDQYLARVNWARDGVFVQSINRDQTILQGRLAVAPNFDVPHSLRDGTQLNERQDHWINLTGDFVRAGSWYLVTSEESGFRHIYSIGGRGRFEALTSGDWPVERIAGKSETHAFFTAHKETPLERHLYSVPLNGGEITRVTQAGKSWSITLSPDGKSFVGISASPAQPPQTGLYKVDGSLITWIQENAIKDAHPYQPYVDKHVTPEFGTLIADDGQTLHYSILKPPGFDPRQKYPVLVEVYGGPGVKTVARDWGRLSDQYYAREGFIVFRLDNRGMASRGKAFEDVIHRKMGGPEVSDQLKGVEWLKAQPFVAADRIAIQGWSYGGYMTLMTLLQAPPGTFAAAVSGAPVTDWRLYDTFYTERYMDTPESNPEGYETSSVFPFTKNLSTPLLLVHGMADDNVTFDNTTRLMANLQENRKAFEVMTYPGQRHGITGESLQTHLMQTRMDFLNRHLKGDAK